MPQGFQPSTSNHSPIPKLPGLLNPLICIGSGKVQRASWKTKTVSSHLLLEDILKAFLEMLCRVAGRLKCTSPASRQIEPSLKTPALPRQSW